MREGWPTTGVVVVVAVVVVVLVVVVFKRSIIKRGLQGKILVNEDTTKSKIDPSYKLNGSLL